MNTRMQVGNLQSTCSDLRRPPPPCPIKRPTIFYAIFIFFLLIYRFTTVSFSDGLGFTGVYIAVDIGVKSHEESKTSVVDVFELSKNLRQDRHGIVCTLEHYNFIYQVLYNKLSYARILIGSHL